jgi:putative membrane protein
MILPGISGSFILLLLGMYSHVLTAVTSFDFALIGLFLLGCMVGLMSFSHLLGWLLSRFKDMTFAVLAGFLLGSLNLLWPWKEVLSTYTNSKGIEKPLSQSNIGPYTYQLVTGQDPHTLACIGIALIGLLLILFIEKITSTEK